MESGNSLRYSILIVFIAGYALTASRFENVAGEYFTYHLVVIGTCTILLVQLKVFTRQYTAISFSLFLIILLYYFRFYWISIDPSLVKLTLPVPAYNALLLNGYGIHAERYGLTLPISTYNALMQNGALFGAFKLSVIVFTIFCLSAAAMLFLAQRRNGPARHTDFRGDAVHHWLVTTPVLVTLFLLILVLGYLAHRYHIGELGTAVREPLPWRLKGIIFYARLVFIPMIILLFIYVAERNGHFKFARLGILLLLIHAVSDMLIRGSRGSLFFAVLLLGFLVVAGGLQLRRTEKRLVVITLMIAFIMVPIISQYRIIRMTDPLLPIIDALSTAVVVVTGNGWASFKEGTVFMLVRLPGVENVAAMLGLGAQPLGMHSPEVLRSPLGVAGHLTHGIYQFPTEVTTSAAPGFVGWLYLVAGVPAVIVGAAAMAVLAVLGWKYLGRAYLYCGPVAQVFLLWMLFVALTEGALDAMGYMVLTGMTSIVIFEIGLRLASRNATPRASQ